MALTVVFIYCFDHYSDYKKQNALLSSKLPLKLNLFAFLSAAPISLYLLFAQQWYQLLTVSSLLIAGLPVVVYFVLSEISNLNKNGTKELIIAISVFLSLHFPALVHHPEQIVNTAYLFFPLLANTFTFSYYEIEKDKSFGFHTFFTKKRARSPYQQALMVNVVIAILALIVSGWNDFEHHPGAVIGCVCYIVAVLFKRKLIKWPFYRMLLDSILLLLLI